MSFCNDNLSSDGIFLKSLSSQIIWVVVQFPTYISGRDVIAQAQSGTGKTATFSIAILQRLDLSLNYCQALVLAPTRELAQQVRTRRLLDILISACYENNNSI